MSDTPKTPPEAVDTTKEAASAPAANPEAKTATEHANDVPTETPAEEAPEGHGDAPRNKKAKLYLSPEMKADPVSRKLIMWSFLFGSLAVICVGLLARTYYQKKHAHDGDNLVVETKPAVVVTQKLDEIHVKLRNEQDLRAELVTECSDRATCDFVKEHPAQVRDLLIPILSAIDPDIFGNVEAKQTMRKNLVDRINTLEMPGKVNQIHFNNFSIEGEVKQEFKKHHE